MNIEIYENQTCNIYINLEGDFEVYGGTTKVRFSAEKTEYGKYKITIPAHNQTICHSSRYDIFARNLENDKEWIILSGKITLKTRYSDTQGGLSPVEFYVNMSMVEDEIVSEDGSILTGIKGDSGKSAYEIVKEHGYTGTEEEFTDLLIDFELSSQRSVDAQIISEICALNALKAAQDAAAILEQIKEVTNND